ncbi:putative DNA binding domain-containing protein [Pedobacter sp. MC2016-14]|uniref:AlbA family DNA-binding domain-containing protein n=1 Tax=Pedobacter sp. MC2016-14 TaxID=2897327 RepID=UPI001E580B7E|nr:RNA-binding domain-containing protein [Pedobacter sp. MC2016-14]MCD0488252.1 putative DNA binding domain-containing protein [Pedobacter sp. MC2016-14]
MDQKRVTKLLGRKEDIHLEYKTASRDQLPKSLFESICAMLNREGGDIFLGVNDNGTILGINNAYLDQLIKDLVNLSNNPSKLDPPFILHPQTLKVDGKIILHITVPVSSEVHKSVNVVYDRSHDGDFKVTQLSKIAALYNSKRNYYSESMVCPAVTMADFKPELFDIARNLIKANNASHPWINLDNEQFMKIAGLYGKDTRSNKEGHNLAAVLLFGTDQTILNTVSYYKVDALVRREDIYRYDDRLYIQTNLIEAYDQLSAFVEKHLPDKFFLRGD